MALFKCKMCGGDLEVNEGVTIMECEYCGTKQTVPTAIDENLQNLFNRANTLRIKSEFDKAEKLYEKIIQADSTQPEAYWGLILCKYGIEYVDDPATFKKIPTCHRASYDSIIADDDYKSAIANADTSQRALYEQQAREIDRIQKEILALAQQEESYDVFICYKETDNDGRRTQDSVIANDIYYQLTQEGFKVFYAAITLEGKLGSAYEPIIFAALNSAKVMLAIGTKPEFFNAVWVKNEWSRYLKIIKKDRSKLLIPCYRDMDAYELPEEFAHLQAQDMGKIGFINDVVRGIKKVAQADAPKPTVIKETVVTAGNANTAPLLKRAFMFLEDGDWNSADEYCEKVLDIDPECAEAYVGKLMVELQVRKREKLAEYSKSFEEYANYKKALRFGNDKLKAELSGYVETIVRRIETARQEKLYLEARDLYKSNSIPNVEKAGQLLRTIINHKDSKELIEGIPARIQEIKEQQQQERKEKIYSNACWEMQQDSQWSLKAAIEKFRSIMDYSDSAKRIDTCEKRLAELKEQEEARRLESKRLAEIARQEEEARAKRDKKIALTLVGAVMIVTAILLVVFKVIVPTVRYNNANKLFANGSYDDAIAVFTELGQYKDSSNKILEVKYAKAESLFANKDYDASFALFTELSGYTDATYRAREVNYAKAGSLAEAGDYEQAVAIYQLLGEYEYKDSASLYPEAVVQFADQLINKGELLKANTQIGKLSKYVSYAEKASALYVRLMDAYYAKGKYSEALDAYKRTKGYSENSDKYKDMAYKCAQSSFDKRDYSLAVDMFEKVKDYKDSKEKIKEAKYQYVISHKSSGDIATYNYLTELKAIGYKDSAKIYKDLYTWKVELQYANSSSSDTSTISNSVYRYCSYFHFSFKITGGPPDETATFYNKVYWPDGSTSVPDWNWEDQEYGDYLSAEWSEGFSISSGTLTVEIRNNDTYELVGSFSIKVT